MAGARPQCGQVFRLPGKFLGRSFDEDLADLKYFQIFDLPWPISDRDYVYRAHSMQDGDGKVLVPLKSTEHSKSPETVGVRAHLHLSKYVLTPISANET